MLIHASFPSYQASTAEQIHFHHTSSSNFFPNRGSIDTNRGRLFDSLLFEHGRFSRPKCRPESRLEAYWKERSVIRREDDVDGRAIVTKDEERVLRGG